MSSNNKYNEEIQEFLRNLTDFDESKREEIIKRIKLKSLSLHKYISEFLIKNNIENKYSYIESIRVYDKRIRAILFKYISMIEEHLRSKLEQNNSKFDYKDILESKDSFYEIINKYVDNNKETFDKLHKIRELRNDVFHNKFIVFNFENVEKIKFIKDFLIDEKIKKEFTNKLYKESEKEIKLSGNKLDLPDLIKENFSNKLSNNEINDELNNLILELNNLNADKMTEFIRDNRENINIYFFIGSGILRYIENSSQLKMWEDMAKEEFKGLKIKKFIDLVTLDIKYKKYIEEINSYEINNDLNSKNNNLRNIWNNFSKFFIRTNTNNKNNRLNIITTNHCDSINKYFQIETKQYYINSINNFFENNYSILKIHNVDKEEIIYKIDHYKSFLENNILDVYKTFENVSKNNSNLYFIFGSSYSELHIQVLIRKLSSKHNNKIIWIRSFDLAEKIDKETRASLEKFMSEYNQKGHLIFFSKENASNLSRNDVLGLINGKIENLFKNGVSAIESKLFDDEDFDKLKNPFYFIKECVNKYNEIPDKKSFLDDLLLKKDFNYICWILLYSENFDECLEWYIENINAFDDSIISINWFISTIEFNEEKYKNHADLVLKCCSNKPAKNINSNGIIEWIELIDISKYNYEWIIEKIWDVFKNIENTESWFKLYEISDQNIEFEKNIEDHIYDFIVSFLKDKMDEIGFITIRKEIFYLFKLKCIIKRNIDIVELILKIKDKTIEDLLTYVNFVDSWELENVNIIFLMEVKKYIRKMNKEDLLNLVNNNNNNEYKDSLRINLYSIIKDESDFDDIKNSIKNVQSDIPQKVESIRNFDVNEIYKEKNEIFNAVNEMINNNEIENVSKIKKIFDDIIISKQLDSFSISTLLSKILNWIISDNFTYLNKNSEITDFLNSFHNYVSKNNIYIYFYGNINDISKTNIELIINYFIKNNFIYLIKSLSKVFMFNGNLNPTFDFFKIHNNNISFIEFFHILNSLENENFKLLKIFENDKYFRVYKNVVENKSDEIENKFIFFKILFDNWYSKIEYNEHDLLNLNEEFFNVLSEILKDGLQINEYCYTLFLKFLLKRNILDVLNVFLCKTSLNFLVNNPYVNNNSINYLFWIFKNNEKDINNEIKEKINNKTEIILKNIEYKKIFNLNYETAEEALEVSKYLYKFMLNKEKISSNEIEYFVNELRQTFTYYDESYRHIIYNKLLSLLLLYDYSYNIGVDYLYKSINDLLDSIDLEKNSNEEIIEKIDKFIDKNEEKYKFKFNENK